MVQIRGLLNTLFGRNFEIVWQSQCSMGCLCDFNAIFILEDKISGTPNLKGIHSINAFLSDLGLFEPTSLGRRFTWTNGQEDPIWVKLDYFVVNNTWVAHLNKLIQNSLPRLGSDHVPICMEVGNHGSTPRPFRFELA